MSKAKKQSPKQKYHIDYRLTGTITVEANSAEAAQEWFDSELANGTPRWFETNGEVENDPPVVDPS